VVENKIIIVKVNSLACKTSNILQEIKLLSQSVVPLKDKIGYFGNFYATTKRRKSNSKQLSLTEPKYSNIFAMVQNHYQTKKEVFLK